jgi:tetratricopeptide (TPR) repeat protein
MGALAGYEKTLGLNHLDTARVLLSNLGGCYTDQGRFKEAEKALSQALLGYQWFQ